MKRPVMKDAGSDRRRGALGILTEGGVGVSLFRDVVVGLNSLLFGPWR